VFLQTTKSYEQKIERDVRECCIYAVLGYKTRSGAEDYISF